jgi:hypothetical protein
MRLFPVDDDRAENGTDVSQLIEPDQFTVGCLDLQGLQFEREKRSSRK